MAAKEQKGIEGTGERISHMVKNGVKIQWKRGQGQANTDTQGEIQSITRRLKNRKCGKEGY